MTGLPQLAALEAESIHILREATAEAQRPVLLYSIGKDSAVLMHLAVKAFHPSKPPFPLLHIDTTWKFRDMITFRDARAREMGLELHVYTNEDGVRRNITPFGETAGVYTGIMKTDALKQALDLHGFDVAFGGARRDEERSRAKERIFSVRSERHRWDPKNQRPEPWRLFNGRKRDGQSLRVFPLSNWTEADVWAYIHAERIPVVPLYFAAPRPVVRRHSALIMVDDDRLPMRPGERPQTRLIRFRTLGCYPLTGAIESRADSIEGILAETQSARTSERSGRLIDYEAAASMECKKQEGYF